MQEYEEECANAVDTLIPERMEIVHRSLETIKEIVNRRIFDEEIEILLTHSEDDLRFWQIRIRGISFSVPKAEIEMLKDALKDADEFECAVTDDERVEVEIGFRDCATRFVKTK